MTRPERRRWSHQDDRLLQEMFDQKMTGAEVAAGLERTYDAVMARSRYLGLTLKSTRSVASQGMTLRSAGISLTNVEYDLFQKTAKQYGFTLSKFMRDAAHFYVEALTGGDGNGNDGIKSQNEDGKEERRTQDTSSVLDSSCH